MQENCAALCVNIPIFLFPLSPVKCTCIVFFLLSNTPPSGRPSTEQRRNDERTFACWMSPFSAVARKEAKSCSASATFDMMLDGRTERAIYLLGVRASGLRQADRPRCYGVNPTLCCVD